MRISDWSSDVCSSDLLDKLAQNVDDLAVEKVEGIADGEQPNHPPCGASIGGRTERCLRFDRHAAHRAGDRAPDHRRSPRAGPAAPAAARKRSEEHTSELQSLMSISYAVLCLKKKNGHIHTYQDLS